MTLRLMTLPYCLLLSVMASVCQAQTAYLELSEIVEGDVATLVVEFENNTPSLFYLDTSPLEESFQVLEVYPSLLTKRKNNKMHNVMHWEVQLYPKRNGKLKIPPLNIKGNFTPELSLEVIDKTSIEDSGERISISVTAVPEDPRIGEQSIITVQLIHNRSLPSGLLSEPVVKQADIHRIGRDKHYRKSIDGETFEVIERRLALFAESTGSLVYPVVEFWGEVESRKTKLAAKQSIRRRIKRESLPIVLDIQPRAANFSGKYWLPAADVKISQQWHGLDSELTTGDSVGRSLTIQADGLPADVLPDDLFNLSNANLIVYPDKAKKQNGVVGNRLSGRVDQAHAIVISGEGNIEIPEIRLKWWDTDEDIEKQVILPGRTIVVSPAVTTEVNNITDFSEKIGDDPSHLIRVKQWLSADWHWLVAVAISAIIGIACFFTRAANKGKKHPQIRFSRSQFKKACFSDDATTVRTQMIIWAREQWPGEIIAGLHLLKFKSDSSEFKQQLADLDAVLFAQNQERWQGQRFWQCFVEAGHQRRNTLSAATGLPSLYPL